MLLFQDYENFLLRDIKINSTNNLECSNPYVNHISVDQYVSVDRSQVKVAPCGMFSLRNEFFSYPALGREISEISGTRY